MNDTVTKKERAPKLHVLLHRRSSFFGAVSNIVRHKNILFQACVLDLRTMYAGTTLGMAWMVLAPLLLLGVYSVVYLFIFRVRPTTITPAEYVLHVAVGLVAFMNFSTALTASAASISRHKSVLLNTVFPAELLPVRAVFVSYAGMVAGLSIVLVAAICLGKLSPLYLLTPIIFLLQLMLSCALGWVLSLLNIGLRDTQHFLQFVIVVFMIASPIGYTPDMVQGKLQLLLYLNPLAYYIQLLQGIIVYNTISWGLFAVSVALAVIPFGAAYWLFQKVKTIFYDYA